MNRVRNIIDRLNRHILIYPKSVYVIVTLFYSTLTTYKGQFATQQYGISKRYWGLFMCIPQVVSLIFGISAAAYVDRLGIQRTIMLGSIIAAMVSFTTFFLVRYLAVFMPLYTVYYSAVAVLLPLLDKVVVDHLESTPGARLSNYGRQKAFVPIGYSVGCYILDCLVSNTMVNGKNVYDFRLLLPYELITGFCSILAVILFVRNLPKRSTASNSNIRHIYVLMRNMEFTYFMIIVFMNGITRSSMSSYINVYYDDHLGFNRDIKNATGLTFYQSLHNTKKKSMAVMAGVVTELIVYFLSVPIVSRFGLMIPVFTSQVLQLLRFAGYYFLNEKATYRFEIVLMLELLKGVSFGFVQFSAATLAMKLVKPSMKSSAQLMYNSTFFAFGAFAAGGGFLFVFKRYETTNDILPVEAYKQVFLIDGILTSLCIALMVFKYCAIDGVLFSIKKLAKKLQEIEQTETKDDRKPKKILDEVKKSIVVQQEIETKV